MVFYWVLVHRGPCRLDAPDATKDSDSTGRRKVLQTQNGSPDASRYDSRIVEVLRCNELSSDTSSVNNTTSEDFESGSENCGEYPSREAVVRKGLPSITHVYLFELFRY